MVQVIVSKDMMFEASKDMVIHFNIKCGQFTYEGNNCIYYIKSAKKYQAYLIEAIKNHLPYAEVK